MANSPPSCFSLLLLLLLLLTSGVNSTTNSRDLGSAMESLRNHGYTLITNAIATSDLQYEILTADDHGPLSSFTLFAPKDDLLFALDMATDAAVYVNTLRYHFVPFHRYTFADLQNLTSPFLDTLLSHYAILVGKVQSGDVFFDDEAVGVMVDGVRVSNPNLYIGPRIAVHGIDGILLTGLSANHDVVDGNENRTEISPPVKSPATESDRNFPAEGTDDDPLFQFDWSVSAPVAPPSNLHGNIQAVPPAPVAERVSDPIPEFDRTFVPPPAVEGDLTPTSHFDLDNVPVTPASTFFRKNLPADGAVTPATHRFSWPDVPGALDEFPLDGNIPVAGTPKMMKDRVKKLKSLAKKKRGKHHGKGRRHHRKHRPINDL